MSRILGAILLVLCCFGVLGVASVKCVDFVTLDIYSVDDDNFNVVCDASKCTITLSSDSESSCRCIGAVVDGKSVILPPFEQEYSARQVVITRYDLDHLKHLGDHKFVSVDGKVTLVEVCTRVFDNWARLAFVKVDSESQLHEQKSRQESQGYQEVVFAPVQLDVCSGDFAHFNRKERDGSDVYSGKAFEKIGNVVCNGRALLDDDNAQPYQRSAKFANDTWTIINVPRIGEEYEHILLPIAPSVKQLKQYRINRYGKTLDIDKDPSFYHAIASRCNDDENEADKSGDEEECIFYDGCSNVSFIIDAIVDGNGNVLLFDPNVKCLVAKLETFGTNDTRRRHLSVYGSLVNSNRPGTWLFVDVGDSDGFHEAKLDPLTLELDNLAVTPQVAKIVDKKDKTSYELVLKPEFRLVNVISTVTRGEFVLVEPTEALPESSEASPESQLISRHVYVESIIDDVLDDDDVGASLQILKIVTIVSEYAHGHPTTQMFQLLDDGGVKPFKPRPIQLDLADVHRPQTSFYVLDVDVSASSTPLPLVGKRRLQGAKKIIVAKSIYKIGSISYNDNLVVPNQFNVHSSECIYNGRDLYVTNYMYSGALVNTWFKLHKISKGVGSKTILCRHFIEESKEPITVDLAKAKELTFHPDLVIVNTGTLGYTEVHVVDVFSTIIGDVVFGSQVLVHRDDDAAERRLFIQGNFPLETGIVHVRTCTAEGDCFVQSRAATIDPSGVVLVPVKKTAVVVDLDEIAAENPPAQVHIVTFGSVAYYRVKDEYATTHKIGNVVYQDKLLVPVTETVDARLLNFAITSRDGKDLTATFRVVDVDAKNDARHGIKYTLTVKHSGNKIPSIDLTPLPPNPIHLNVNVCGGRHTTVGLKHHNNVYTFYVPWTKAPDYALASIVYESFKDYDGATASGHSDGEGVVVQDTLIEPKAVDDTEDAGAENTKADEYQFLSRAVHVQVYKQDLNDAQDEKHSFVLTIQAPIHSSNNPDAVDFYKCTINEHGQTHEVQQIEFDKDKLNKQQQRKTHPHNPQYYTEH